MGYIITQTKNAVFKVIKKHIWILTEAFQYPIVRHYKTWKLINRYLSKYLFQISEDDTHNHVDFHRF